MIWEITSPQRVRTKTDTSRLIIHNGLAMIWNLRNENY